MLRINRRTTLKTGAAALGSLFASPLFGAETQRTILLHSGWQIENIGDIAHSPGVLALLDRHLAEVRILYWPNSINAAIEDMLRRRFPRLEIVRGTCDSNGKPTTEALAQAFEQADLMMHGSGPSVVGHARLNAWRRQTGKPYGIYGVTIQEISPALKELLDGAAFVFTRETHSLRNLREARVEAAVTGFAPDGTFALDLIDDAHGLPFLSENGLTAQQFLCIVPRLRYTPYHKIRKVSWSAEEIRRREEHNAKYAELDHGKLREVMVRFVRETGQRVLVCPEMTYALEIIDPLLIDPLPDDVKPHVVARRTYWLPDEAASVYRRAMAVVSMECHSPIIAAAMGTPCFYVRQPEDTIKGQMWYDVGLTNWVFEIDATRGEQIAERVMQVRSDRDAARAYLAGAMQEVQRRHSETMGDVARTMGIG